MILIFCALNHLFDTWFSTIFYISCYVCTILMRQPFFIGQTPNSFGIFKQIILNHDCLIKFADKYCKMLLSKDLKRALDNEKYEWNFRKVHIGILEIILIMKLIIDWLGFLANNFDSVNSFTKMKRKGNQNKQHLSHYLLILI